MIGSLYSYFKDKDTIFFEILDRYHDKFDMENKKLLDNPELMKQDFKAWLKALILNLIKVHEDTLELNRELTIISYHNPAIAKILEQNKAKTMQATIGYFIQLRNDLHIEDPAASAIVIFDLLNATVDRIVFGNNEIDRDRLIHTTIDAVYKYFYYS